jgi:hypothetical protein
MIPAVEAIIRVAEPKLIPSGSASIMAIALENLDAKLQSLALHRPMPISTEPATEIFNL